MRPLPVEFVGGAPEFVSGLSIVRGVTLPVVDTGSLLVEKGSPYTSFVIVMEEFASLFFKSFRLFSAMRTPIWLPPSGPVTLDCCSCCERLGWYRSLSGPPWSWREYLDERRVRSQ
jgi:hypothetical protein